MGQPASAASDRSQAPRGGEPYDPLFDPLTVAYPGRAQPYAPTYWVATAGPPPTDDGRVVGDIDVDVAIVGSGFTGLATALFLAEEHGIRTTVLEAAQLAWGCTSRNGGQGQISTGRLYRSQCINRWGKEVALRLDHKIRTGFECFRSLVRRIDCDAQDGGHRYAAHRPKKLPFLEAEAEVLRAVFGCDARMLSAEEIRDRYVDDRDCCGALREPDGIGVHPLTLAYGYARLARAQGVRIHTGMPVTAWSSRAGRHHLYIPGGTVRAQRVAIATGGYTTQALSPLRRKRCRPVLSNSIVTRPLTAAEREASRFRAREVITDTRTLRHYYRLLPDARVQIGGRSAIRGRDAAAPRHLEVLLRGRHRKFPTLPDAARHRRRPFLVGWVDMSHYLMPRIVQPDREQAAYYTLGYGGNGVASSAHAARRLAQLVAGRADSLPRLPIYDSPLPGHPLAPLHRLGQALLYRWYFLRDEYLCAPVRSSVASCLSALVRSATIAAVLGR